MFTILALLVAAAVVTLVVVVLTKPNSFRLQRSLSIQAPPEAIYPLIDDFHNWPQWSPWERVDTTMQRTYSGEPDGVGAVYDWSGSGKAGTGRMAITEAEASSRILIALDFFKPFKASNKAEFTLQPQDGGTVVTWAMYGPSPFISKLMSLVFNMETTVGPDFEAGLHALKTLSEGKTS